jgi:hypothetical protein
LPETPYGETELRPSTRHASHFPEGTIQTRSARVWLGKDGIVRIQAYSLKREELDDAMANVAAVAKVTGGSKRQLLVDLSSAGPQSHEAREYYMSAESKKNTTAMAIVTGSLLGRIVGSFRARPRPWLGSKSSICRKAVRVLRAERPSGRRSDDPRGADSLADRPVMR